MQTILVIDDNEELRASISAGLANSRYHVLQASNSRRGVELACLEMPDLVLCDLDLGESDAVDTFDLLRQNPITCHVPLILMTGHPENDCQGAGAILIKPFTLTVLLEAVRRQLNRGPSDDPDGADLQLEKTQEKDVSKTSALGIPSPLRPGPAISREQYKDLLVRSQSLRESDRARVTQAIHDDLLQTMTVIGIEVSLLRRGLTSGLKSCVPEDYLNSVEKLSNLVTGLIRSTQKITAGLRPKVLDELGLAAALAWLISLVGKKTGIHCALVASGSEVKVNPELAGEIYCLAEEMIWKSASLPEVTTLSIHLFFRSQEFRLDITDNGKTLPTEESDVETALETLGIRERAERLGGAFGLTGISGGGTQMSLSIPLGTEFFDSLGF